MQLLEEEIRIARRMYDQECHRYRMQVIALRTELYRKRKVSNETQ
ncbi:MAG TPA: hypothetical protein VM783_17980 [Candidatus Acidoferrum sp.]|nr:hypothetical protein [Candidatus Acidoferrum sp.]